MIYQDPEFGEVMVRKSHLATGVKFSISTSGRLRMSVPNYTSNFLIKRFLNSSRKQIRAQLPLKNPDARAMPRKNFSPNKLVPTCLTGYLTLLNSIITIMTSSGFLTPILAGAAVRLIALFRLISA